MYNQAYYQKAKLLHPDINKQDVESFKALNYAYQILNDDIKRKFYDQQFLNVKTHIFDDFQTYFDQQFKYRDSYQNNYQQANKTSQQEHNYSYYNYSKSQQNRDGAGEYYHKYSQSQNSYNNYKQYKYTKGFYDNEQNYNTARKSSQYKDFYNTENMNMNSSQKYGFKQYYQEKKNLFQRTKFAWFLGLVFCLVFDQLWEMRYGKELEEQIMKDLEISQAQKKISNVEKDKIQSQYKDGQTPQQTEILRANMFMGPENVNDSWDIQERRKKNMEVEQKQKKFSIIMVNDPNKNKKKLSRKEQMELKRKQKEGMESLENLGKNFNVKVNKTTQKKQTKTTYNMSIDGYQRYNQSFS
ncbi:DnaJ domain [Pseudocohnilembus persalinus]|uniref:DnaJ domain n=1 Tax=Pseudocohnilembus persalinus TaxID=266149 RepID=A0A0V0QNH0_PSEPJ|nr:DnaJ domain [Pseudocohnilembus persalinus]|eukprot:KRX03810.1 DnaJ domain [Pseudocohnilembus persalinus]